MQKLIHNCLICSQKGTLLKGQLRTYLRSQNRIFCAEFASCNTCEYAWMLNPPSEEELNQYYQSGSQLRIETVTVNDQIHFKTQICFALDRRNIGKDFRALEVGADTGQFLDELRNKISAKHIHYTELNNSARETLKQKGYTEFDPQHDTHFDIIIFRHVIEHIPNPQAFLRQFTKHLSTDGEIFIEVPDFTLRVKGETDDFMFEHLHYFSIESLIRLGLSVGLRVKKVEIAKTPGYRMTSNNVLRLLFQPEPEIEKFATLDMQQLLDKSQKKIERLLTYLRDFQEGEVALFGAGWLTTELVASPEATSAILFVMDSDPEKVGTCVGKYTIVSVEKLFDSRIKKIIIMSIAFQDDINRFLISNGFSGEMIEFASNYLEVSE